jgi:hypothetical protein
MTVIEGWDRGPFFRTTNDPAAVANVKSLAKRLVWLQQLRDRLNSVVNGIDVLGVGNCWSLGEPLRTVALAIDDAIAETRRDLAQIDADQQSTEVRI